MKLLMQTTHRTHARDESTKKKNKANKRHKTLLNEDNSSVHKIVKKKKSFLKIGQKAYDRNELFSA